MVEIKRTKVLAANFGAGRDELVQAVSHAFGFSSTSAQLRSVIESSVDALVASAKTLSASLRSS
jgi:hypothetical protein